MRLLACIVIDEKDTRIFGCSVPNRPLAVLLALFQLTVSIASFLQHIYSIYTYKHVFLCNSNIPKGSNFTTHVLAHDVIIFDFGLMHRVLGTEACVANYLDGGYMRMAWTVEQSSALSLCIIALIFFPRPLWLLWPGLLMQSSYSLGLSVLTMATAPKLLEAMGGRIDFELAAMFVAYVIGFMTNWMFTFVLWHYYWYQERIQTPPTTATSLAPSARSGLSPAQTRRPVPTYV